MSFQRKIITVAIMVAMFLAAMEATIVNAAMPTIVGALGGFSLYSWVFSAFMLTNTTTVPIYGKLADMYGRKVMFITAVTLFVLGSALSGQANTMVQLVLFRGIQGLGAGGVLPLALTIAGDMFPLEQRAKVQGLFSSVWGLSAIIGPFIGGFIVDHFSWRWLFYLNLPFGILVVVLVVMFLPKQTSTQNRSAWRYFTIYWSCFSIVRHPSCESLWVGRFSNRYFLLDCNDFTYSLCLR
ncbi:MFS transporter [Tepidibacillus fermentans]|uniref:MFS transporter n=1 Tax=Tepidibacillus fermentans TaxID=1281767 RepID=A0A4R3KDN5_9BACI|nr:MFS transporter [Tepidibacillus fermentans]TCS81268.1 MFS transporter [Tepidibacillus fermentans]